MNILFFLAILIFASHHALATDNKTTVRFCNRLPNGCKLKTYKNNRYSPETSFFLCKSLGQNFKFDINKFMSKDKCKGFNEIRTIYFRSDKSVIMDYSFDYINVAGLLGHIQNYRY